ncbi:hypothetical protein DCS_07662 [Drechmeria coniospora]|uniref:Uncharacterized protein n=1 Tax=Drechmeria coniospora TaxID=98403 RepID=A0A151GF27_DRECN|nr:hypothetical protein DCS_07662 [Drechmeria coniospora]KYK55698.1 hypothetical protein DCS_07662 [Drechmeria coniospora]
MAIAAAKSDPARPPAGTAWPLSGRLDMTRRAWRRQVPIRSLVVGTYAVRNGRRPEGFAGRSGGRDMEMRTRACSAAVTLAHGSRMHTTRSFVSKGDGRMEGQDVGPWLHGRGRLGGWGKAKPSVRTAPPR